ncbi:MAG TPA: DUF4058 family protein, partial [Gemmataceae bacterium]
MANPFPGMDPYLEGDLWPSVYHSLANEISRRISPVVRPKYIALCVPREVMATPDPTELSPQWVGKCGPGPIRQITIDICEPRPRRSVT